MKSEDKFELATPLYDLDVSRRINDDDSVEYFAKPQDREGNFQREIDHDKYSLSDALIAALYPLHNAVEALSNRNDENAIAFTSLIKNLLQDVEIDIQIICHRVEEITGKVNLDIVPDRLFGMRRNAILWVDVKNKEVNSIVSDLQEVIKKNTEGAAV